MSLRWFIASIAPLALPCSAAVHSFTESRQGAMGNNQIGFMTMYNIANLGVSRSGAWPLGDIWAAEAEYAEVIEMTWRQMMVGTSKTDVAVEEIETRLNNLYKRGKQGVLRIYGQNPKKWINDTGVGRNLPEFFYTDIGLQYCVDTSGIVVADYNNAGLLSNIELISAALGARFNNDKRLHAVEIGFVGYNGQWEHGFFSSPVCLPSPEASARIVNSIVGAFPNTFVVMPSPWNARGYDYSRVPALGYLDSTFGAHFNAKAEKLAAIGLGDRWKTAPFMAAIRPELEYCWFANPDPAPACASAGLSKNISTFVEAVKMSHVSLVEHGDLFKTHSQSQGALDILRDSFLQTGAVFHITSVAIQTANERLSLCAMVTNLGSAPYYSLPGKPLTLDAEFHYLKQPMKGATQMSGLLPGETQSFSVDYPFATVTDECIEKKTVCEAAGQTCNDPDKSPFSLGDWECLCSVGSQKERSRPAVCVRETYRLSKVTTFDTQTFVDVGTDEELGLVGGSFAVSVKAKLNICGGTPCNEDTAGKNEWEKMTIVGSLSVPSSDPIRRAMAFVYEAKGLRSEFFRSYCNYNGRVDAIPVNKWVHLVMAYDVSQKTMKLYLDGKVLTSCTTFEPMRAGGRIALGRSWEGLAFKGWMKDVRFLSGTITEQDVAYLGMEQESREPLRVNIALSSVLATRPLKFATSVASSPGAAMSPDGVLSVPVPQVQAGMDEGCLALGPTPPPSPAPTRLDDVAGCMLLELSGFVVDSGESFCDGIYLKTEAAGSGVYWSKVEESGRQALVHPRMLWPHTTDGYRCTFREGSSSSHYIKPNHTQAADWWAWHLGCLAQPTSAPDTAEPISAVPATPEPTSAPPTAAPRTSAPPTVAPLTVAPPTAAPGTALPTAIPTQAPPGTTGSPQTNVPLTMVPPDTATPTPLSPRVLPFTGSPYSLAPDTTAPDTAAPSNAPSSAPTNVPPLMNSTDEPEQLEDTPEPLFNTSQPVSPGVAPDMPVSAAVNAETDSDTTLLFVILMVVSVVCLVVAAIAWKFALKKRHANRKYSANPASLRAANPVDVTHFTFDATADDGAESSRLYESMSPSGVPPGPTRKTSLEDPLHSSMASRWSRKTSTVSGAHCLSPGTSKNFGVLVAEESGAQTALLGTSPSPVPAMSPSSSVFGGQAYAATPSRRPNVTTFKL